MRPPFQLLKECFQSSLRGLKFHYEGKTLYASYIEGGHFPIEVNGEVTPGGVWLLSRTAKRGTVKVKGERKAMLFLYGRDLFKGSYEIVKKPCEKGFVLVYWKGILLGLGKLNKGNVKNLLDFGEYLRRGV